MPRSRQLGDIHVARGAGAEKDDVLEPFASFDQRRRQVGVVVDADVVAVEQSRQLGRRERGAIDVDRRIVGAHDPLPHRRQLIVAVDEQRFHHYFLLRRPGTFLGKPCRVLKAKNCDRMGEHKDCS